MNSLVVDDKQLAVSAVVRIVNAIDPEGACEGVRTPEAALEYVSNHPVDVAFLDVEMPQMTGLELAKRMKEVRPNVNIVFVTAYEEYAFEAHKLYASGYLLKPVKEEDVRAALENLRHPVEPAKSSRLQVRCFGNFDVFVDEQPLKFKRTKSKEMLAYLVDRRGSRCTIGELVSVLWDDDAHSPSRRTQVRNLISDLRSALKDAGAEDILVRGRDEIAIVPESIDCDYYRFLDGDPAAVNLYRGEYMSQYSWAEMTAGTLSQQ